ncbi:MAG: pirin family protein [Candidatus Thorarchaeota archaeon]
MTRIRNVKSVWRSTPTSEGAGVRLKRVFGNRTLSELDPFLLLDDFHSDNPNDYIAGFPWHPHRGIETITYLLEGDVKHGDSLGNGGVIGKGDVQWMTAGSGIVHEEMPHQKDGLLWGFQLWANLPASHKMMHPWYRDIKAQDIPTIVTDNGIKVKIISGQVGETKGPVEDVITEPEYLDVTIPANTEFSHEVKAGHTVFAYIIKGSGTFNGSDRESVAVDHLVLFDDGTEVVIESSGEGVRFLLISGKPIGEPVAWYGPIVMNTQEELRIAFEEYRNGTFLKHD